MTTTAKWVTVTKPCEIKLDLDADFEFADNNVQSITVRDGKGGAFRVLRGEYQALKVVVPAPPVMVKSYVLEGTMFDDVYRRVFDDESEARDVKHKFESRVGGDCDLKITTISHAEGTAA